MGEIPYYDRRTVACSLTLIKRKTGRLKRALIADCNMDYLTSKRAWR